MRALMARRVPRPLTLRTRVPPTLALGIRVLLRWTLTVPRLLPLRAVLRLAVPQGMPRLAVLRPVVPQGMPCLAVLRLAVPQGMPHLTVPPAVPQGAGRSTGRQRDC